jgi:acetyl esterase/lipase/lysophospholipase L1-like esterase
MKTKLSALSVLVLCAGSLLFGRNPERPVHLFLAGDSTMANKAPAPENPERGWGEALPYFFNGAVTIDNRALNGRSSLSFRSEGHWEALLGDLVQGDWVLIQFGHNDQKSQDPTRYAAAHTEYRENLIRFIREVREHGGNPLLATSIVRRLFDEAGQLISTHGDYPEVTREVARSENVPLIDLHARTREFVRHLGEARSKDFYLWPAEGMYARFPEGTGDNTHLSNWGASLVAQMAVEEITRLKLALSDAVEKPITDFASTEWIDLLPRAPGDTEKERLENERISNVRNPSIGIFRSTLGRAPRAAVVICPGGGYSILAIVKEGYEVARWFNSLGIDAYVLKYRLKEFGYPAPLQDVTLAVRFLRATAEERGIDPQKIGVMGFSAGGHTAAMATMLYASDDALTGGPLDAVSARPDFSVLAYPVISMTDAYTHMGSRTNLLGNEFDPEMIRALSLENRVSNDTPPVFLFHTADDAAVPVENSLNFAEAMARYGRPFALHVFASAPHGIGMRPGFGTASSWPMLLGAWLKEQGVIAEK